MSAVSSSGPSQRANSDGVPSAAVSDPIHPAFGQRERPGAEFEQLASGLKRATEAPPHTERTSIARDVVCTIGSSRQTSVGSKQKPAGNLVALSDWTATDHACGPDASSATSPTRPAAGFGIGQSGAHGCRRSALLLSSSGRLAPLRLPWRRLHRRLGSARRQFGSWAASLEIGESTVRCRRPLLARSDLPQAQRASIAGRTIETRLLAPTPTAAMGPANGAGGDVRPAIDGAQRLPAYQALCSLCATRAAQVCRVSS